MVTIIAHRGFSSILPENTISAFKKAVELQAEFIELDVLLTKDLVPIVIHDDSTGRTTNDFTNRYICDLEYHDIQLLDAGLWFSKEHINEKIPTLQEALQLANEKTRFFIEIKETQVTTKQKYIEIIHRILMQFPHKHIIGSFDLELLDLSLQKDPSLAICGLVETEEQLHKFLGKGFSHIGIWDQLINETTISYLKQKKITVWTFTADIESEWERLIDLQVDGIITNELMALQQHVSQKVKNLNFSIAKK
ncbi:Glycerophosphoryl diester phosphodiesterase [Candidatus Rubidus massiliensis]|nr:Glycerophosphoryl diester phosphodiesterase [Candidatus Rubidus massiliensis]